MGAVVLRCLGGAGQARAGTIPNGGALSGTISVDGEIDLHSFSGTAGQKGLISISGSITTGEYFEVYNPDGTRLTGSSSHVRIDLAQDGTYEVRVRSFQSRGTGNYEVHLALAAGANEHDSIANGGSVSEAIDADGEIDSFVFFGRAGGQATVELASMVTTGGYIYVFAPDGAPVAGTGSSQRFALPSSGPYTVVVQSFQSRGTGDYTVRLDISYTVPPTTEVLFVNGIFTFAEAARDAAVELEVRAREVMSEDESQRVRFGLIYNRTYLLLDLFETLQQLQTQEGRSANFGDLALGYLLSQGSREAQIGVAAGLLVSDITAEIDTQRAVGRIRIGQILNERTVLVGYYQGNLFVNEAYGRLDPLEQARTSVLGVATPALRTVDGGPHTTLCGDAVINGLLLTGFMPLPPNAAASPSGCSGDFLNHSFTGAYLTCANTRTKILWELREALQFGNTTPSQSEACR